MRPKLSFANVLSVLALFVALGGSAYAFHLGKNSVGSTQLKKNAVTTTKIKNGAVTGRKIKAATLRTVPSAANAQTLGGLSADQITQGSKLRCPAGTTLAGGVCFESATRAAAPFIEALETCASLDRSLPSPGELASYLSAHPPQKAESNWAGSFYVTGEFRGLRVGVQPNGELDIGDGPISGKGAYRCATSPTN